MRIGPFVFTSVARLQEYATNLALVMRAPDEIVASLLLYTRLVTGKTNIAKLRQINDEIDLQLALQEENENGSDPQSGEIATESQSGL